MFRDFSYTLYIYTINKLFAGGKQMT